MGRADRDEEEENVLYSGQATPRSSSRPGTGHGHAHEADEALRAGMRGAGMQEEDVKPTKYVYGLTLAAGISGLLFGCSFPSHDTRPRLT